MLYIGIGGVRLTCLLLPFSPLLVGQGYGSSTRNSILSSLFGPQSGACPCFQEAAILAQPGAAEALEDG